MPQSSFAVLLYVEITSKELSPECYYINSGIHNEMFIIMHFIISTEHVLQNCAVLSSKFVYVMVLVLIDK